MSSTTWPGVPRMRSRACPTLRAELFRFVGVAEMPRRGSAVVVVLVRNTGFGSPSRPRRPPDQFVWPFATDDCALRSLLRRDAEFGC
jgi:hypothetical protein